MPKRHKASVKFNKFKYKNKRKKKRLNEVLMAKDRFKTTKKCIGLELSGSR
jgi:hypothetical protein